MNKIEPTEYDFESAIEVLIDAALDDSGEYDAIACGLVAEWLQRVLLSDE